MRIGMMLRAIDEVDGPGVYIRALCKAVLEYDTENTYVFFYMRRSQVGGFREFPNVVERVLPAPSKLLWDQVMVPLAARRDSLDVLFHHKFSIPLWSPCPTVVQQRGSEYWTVPQWYSPLNRVYSRTAIPLYCRRATRVLTNSETLAKELATVARIPIERMGTIPAAADRSFQPVTDPDALAAIRRKYALPLGGFLLSVATGQTSGKTSAESTVDRKNVDGICRAYGRLASSGPRPPLVVVGRGFEEQTRARLLALAGEHADVVFAGYVDHADMPAIYSMATALVFPSHSESFGIPLVEAMASGCPVITSTTGACPEVVGPAAIVVDPNDVAEIAGAMRRLLDDEALAGELRVRGLERAQHYSWAASGRKLVEELTTAAGAP